MYAHFLHTYTCACPDVEMYIISCDKGPVFNLQKTAKFGMFLIILVIPAFSLLAIGMSFIHYIVVS